MISTDSDMTENGRPARTHQKQGKKKNDGRRHNQNGRRAQNIKQSFSKSYIDSVAHVGAVFLESKAYGIDLTPLSQNAAPFLFFDHPHLLQGDSCHYSVIFAPN